LIPSITNGVFSSATEGRSRESYRWFLNSCFIDAGLEVLFRAFIQWPEESKQTFLKNVANDSYLYQLIQGFMHRLDWIHDTSPNLLPSVGSRILAKTQAFARYYVYSTWKRWPQDQPGDTTVWIEQFLFEANAQVGFIV
jgi:hypothetical protein